MTEVNPPAFLQNAGTTHTAEITREIMNVLCGGGQHPASTQKAIGGVNPALGLTLNVSQNGSPNMSVNIGSGHALVFGTEAGKQALYSVFNDATLNKTVAASDPSLPRVDLVVARVRDSFYSGVTNAWALEVITGTPAGSPVAPATPANSLVLATIAVGAGVTSIVNANISNGYQMLSAIGGIKPVRSRTERDALVGAYDGLAVWRQDNDYLQINNSGGSVWRSFGRPVTATTANTQTSSSTSYVDLATVGPSVTLETGDAAEVTIVATIGNSAGAHCYMSFAVSGATTLAASDLRAFFGPVGNIVTLASRFTATYMVTGLTAGDNTFTAKYRVGTGTGTWENRTIFVRPL